VQPTFSPYESTDVKQNIVMLSPIQAINAHEHPPIQH